MLSDGSLASGSWDNTIRIWDTESGETIKILKGHNGWIHTLVALSDGFHWLVVAMTIQFEYGILIVVKQSKH